MSAKNLSIDICMITCSTLYQTTNFGLVQIQKICRRQNNVVRNLKFTFKRVENIVGKGENTGDHHLLCFTKNFHSLSIWLSEPSVVWGRIKKVCYLLSWITDQPGYQPTNTKYCKQYITESVPL